MSAEIRTEVAIVVPAQLVWQLEQLVVEYADSIGETPENARRAVEIGVLQMGIRSLQASAAQYRRMSATIENESKGDPS